MIIQNSYFLKGQERSLCRFCFEKYPILYSKSGKKGVHHTFLAKLELFSKEKMQKYFLVWSSHVSKFLKIQDFHNHILINNSALGLQKTQEQLI